jgi:PPOX class probable F420-dependent enzyme
MRVPFALLVNPDDDRDTVTIMAQRIPDGFLDLFQGRAFGHLATVMADGTPQLTPVWVAIEDVDGEQHVLVNSAQGRLKNRNMTQRPQVAIEVQDPAQPYRYVSVRGTVVSVSTEGGAEHIEQLSLRYLGRGYPWWRDGEVREVLRIRPDRVLTVEFS